MLIFLSFRTETNLIQVTNFKRNVVKSLLRVLFIEKVLALVHLTLEIQLCASILSSQ